MPRHVITINDQVVARAIKQRLKPLTPQQLIEVIEQGSGALLEQAMADVVNRRFGQIGLAARVELKGG